MFRIVFAALWLALCLMTGSANAANRPNILLVMVDDFGYECVTANGGQSYQTPNLDKLATSGMRFENCHVQPLCTPTRVQLMTGKYNIRNYLNFGTLVRTEITFGHLLKQAGYRTGICGKWQLGHEKDSPQHFGFEESCLWQQTRRPPRYANPGLEYQGVEKDFENGEYGPQLVQDFAMDFLTKHKAEPFFLYYPMMLTHSPFQPTPDSSDWDPKAKGENVNNQPRHFADMTAFMDKQIGQLDAKLSELGIRDNTILLIVGDNGTGGGITSRLNGAEYKGGKGTTTQHGTHVPFIASWPAVMKKGKVQVDLISSVDFLPTLCEAAGVGRPEAIDGVSFLAQLKGESGTPRDSIYYWYSPRQGTDTKIREFAFDHRYKLYRNGDFFDLKADPLEKNPIEARASDAVAAKAKLMNEMNKYQAARPAALDQAFEQLVSEKPVKGAKKKAKDDE